MIKWTLLKDYQRDEVWMIQDEGKRLKDVREGCRCDLYFFRIWITRVIAVYSFFIFPWFTFCRKDEHFCILTLFRRICIFTLYLHFNHQFLYINLCKQRGPKIILNSTQTSYHAIRRSSFYHRCCMDLLVKWCTS